MKQKTYYAIGGMSGTSLDGVDLCYCHYQKQSNKKWQFECLHAKTYVYPKNIKNKIEALINNYTDKHEDLDKTLGAFYANLVQQFIKNYSISQIDFFANHGQTVYHNPAIQKTVQIGCGKTIAKQTGLQTINNFRVKDVALGGQGAPLVPIGDWHFFNAYRYCINLGGIANITIQDVNKVLVAFDICPCNVLLNHYANQLNLPYDDNGTMAQKGKLRQALLDKLNHLPYYHVEAPKSLDAQICKEIFIPLIDAFELPTQDILHTLCHHYAYQIAQVIQAHTLNNQEQILLSGGGALNGFLSKLIQDKSRVQVHIPDKVIIEFKEAIVFGLLGVLKLENEVNCLKVVTGASQDNVGGQIFS